MVEYLPFHSYWKDSVDSVSPGLLYLACALCLYIALGCRDEYISKVDFSLIVMVVSYQFLMQVSAGELERRCSVTCDSNRYSCL